MLYIYIYIYICEPQAAEHLRVHATTSFKVASEDFTKVGFELSLLRNNLEVDRCIAEDPLQSQWDGIAFTKDTLCELFNRHFPVLQTLYSPMSPSRVTSLVNADFLQRRTTVASL